jgi:hypothetical protein
VSQKQQKKKRTSEGDTIMESTVETKTWPELAGGLYDKLTGRGAEITYEFDNLEVLVPSSASPDAVHAKWKVSGTMKIRTQDQNGHKAP